jgi:hypothetical protein
MRPISGRSSRLVSRSRGVSLGRSLRFGYSWTIPLLLAGLCASSVSGQVDTNLPARAAGGSANVQLPANQTDTPGEERKPRTPGSYLGLTPQQEQDALAGIEAKIRALNDLSSRGFDNPLVRARFEKYLNAPEADSKDVEAYTGIIRNIQAALQRRDARAAGRMLYELSNFEWDADIGGALAARVEAAWDMRLSRAQLEEKVRTLRKEIDQSVWNTEVLMKDFSLISPEQPQQSGRTSSSSSADGATPSTVNTNNPYASSTAVQITPGSLAMPPKKLRAMEEYLKRLEAGARLKASELKSDVIEAQNRSDFQDYVSTLFNSRRHLHTILAADFYRTVFGGGDYPPAIANQVNLSKEILRDVEQAVTVFNFKMEHGELAGALEHLQYAFAASEFHPALLTLSRDSKRKVRGFGFNLAKLQNMLEARDFGDVEPMLKEMRAQATDFDATKVRAIMDAVKLESRLRLGAARLAAQDGDLKTAMAEFRAAAQTWPGNPDLDMAQLGFFNAQDIKTQLQQEFDRLVEAKNFRGIFEKQLQLATGLVGDSARIDQMKAALEKVKAVETAIEKANIFRRNNNAYGAWESLETAARDWPDDSLLNKMRAELAAESADFVHQIKRGEEAERAGNLGFSLACYLNAQRLYPASELAQSAVQRVSARILNQGS